MLSMVSSSLVSRRELGGCCTGNKDGRTQDELFETVQDYCRLRDCDMKRRRSISHASSWTALRHVQPMLMPVLGWRRIRMSEITHELNYIGIG